MASSHLEESTSVESPHLAHTAEHGTGHGGGLTALTLGALGVVFGDIGTSPLYTLKECLHTAGGTRATVADLFGILSLMFWAASSWSSRSSI